MEITRILCPTDLSDASAKAWRQAEVLALATRAELIGLHVASPLEKAVPGLSPDAGPPHAGQADDQLRRWCEDASRRGVLARYVVQVGSPAACILRSAEDGGVSLIVMGTHGHGGFEHLLLGSVAEKVLRKASCPVLTVPPHASDRPAPAFTRVLCGVDFSDASVAALRAAADLARGAGGEIIAVHVLEWPWNEGPEPRFEGIPPAQAAALAEYRRYAETSARARLAGLLAECGPHPHPADSRVVHGHADTALLTVAAGEQADVIVLGVRGRRALELNVLGSTANQVVRRAPCPVLTMRG